MVDGLSCVVDSRSHERIVSSWLSWPERRPVMQNPLKIFQSLMRRFGNASPAQPEDKADRMSANAIGDTINRALDAAGLHNDGADGGVRSTIEQALAGAGLVKSSSPHIEAREPWADQPFPAAPPDHLRRTAPSAEPQAEGRFLGASFSSAEGSRAYRLYIPSAYETSAEFYPLIIMLHGCTQSPEDFAAGTRMNALADRHHFLVAYPSQPQNANGSRCWNWFKPHDQLRAHGEPSLIAGIAAAIASEYRVDRKRVFVAGLSAGAAMAVVLGQTYPDIFSAVGAHSGLPYAAAHDVASAFGAMKMGRDLAPVKQAAGAGRGPQEPVRTIVFHGNADQTVDMKNGAAIASEAAAMFNGGTGGAPNSTYGEGIANGRRYTRRIYANGDECPMVEHWVIEGAGHAWSGGSRQGSYTDPTGPDASSEMIRFFLEQDASNA